MTEGQTQDTPHIVINHANKSYGVAAALCFFLGGFGAHKFYLNKPVLGILYVVFSWTFIPLLLSIFELLDMLFRGKRNFDTKYNDINNSKNTKQNSSNGVAEVSLILVLMSVGFALLMVACSEKPDKASEVIYPDGYNPQIDKDETLEVEETTQLDEEIIEYAYITKSDTTNSVVRNIATILMEPLSENDTIIEAAQFIQNDLNCFSNCNLSIYDNEEAYGYDSERTNLSTAEEIAAWDENHYIFVADHLIAFKSFETDTAFLYPYKDWYYEELKK